MSALDRARAWFVAPLELPPAADEPTWFSPPPTEQPRAERRWMPPVPDDESHQPVAPPPCEHVAPAEVTSAAVLGKPGEVEPVAAALALALRRSTRAKAATVVVIGAAPHQLESANTTSAARRLGSRLQAQGFEPSTRGRLAWVHLDPEEEQLAPIARRLALTAAPAVFALAAPRGPAIDATLAEQDLLVLVTDDPDGPLAQLAGLPGASFVSVRPLHRSPARALARAGRRSPAAIRRLLDEEDRR